MDEKEEAKAEAIAKLAAEYADDPDKLAEAEEWISEDLQGDHTTATTLALYNLHITDPSSLLGSDLLTKLYRLAKVVAENMDAELYRMAEDELENRRAGEEP